MDDKFYINLSKFGLSKLFSEQPAKVEAINGEVDISAEQLVRHFGSALRPDVFPGTSGSGINVLLSGNDDDRIIHIVADDYRSGMLRSEHSQRTSVGTYYNGKTGNVDRLYIPKDRHALEQTLAELERIDPRLAQAVRYTIQNNQPVEGLEAGFLAMPSGLCMKVVPFEHMVDEVLAVDVGKSRKAYQEVEASGIMNLPHSVKERYTGSPDKTVTVIQGEVAFIHSGEGKQIANTYGIADCVGMILGDEIEGAYALAHVDAATDIKASFPSIVGELQALGAHTITLRLFGGQNTSGKIVTELIEQARAYGIEIVEADIMDRSQTRSVGISTNGTIYNNTFSDKAADESERLQAYRGTTKVLLSTRYDPKRGRH